MKTSYLLLLCVIVLLNSGCKKCETTTHYPFPVAAELYFGMYKQGNWWTYENQDGTKKDSIYFTAQFFDYIGKEPAIDDCVTWQYRHGNMGSRYLYRKSNNGVNYAAFTYDNRYSCDINYTRIGLSIGVSENFAICGTT